MNLSATWVDFLVSKNVEAVHWSRLGAVDAPDHLIMSYAIDHNMIVLTNDLDFSAMLAGIANVRPSVVQLRSSVLRPTNIGDRVVLAMRQAEAELEQGALLTIDIAGARLRILPLIRRT